MPHSEAGDVTGLLNQTREGDPSAVEKLIPLIRRQMRSLAARQMRFERPGHTLQPTALVNEAYVRLIRGIPVDYARLRQSARRSGGQNVELTKPLPLSCENLEGLPAVEDALVKLEQLAPRQSRLGKGRICYLSPGRLLPVPWNPELIKPHSRKSAGC